MTPVSSVIRRCPAALARVVRDNLRGGARSDRGHQVRHATLGGCNRGVSPKALRYLLGCPRLLVAYDVEPRATKAPSGCSDCRRRMQRVRPPVGKDVTACWQADGRVRDWVQFELARLVVAPRTGNDNSCRCDGSQ